MLINNRWSIQRRNEYLRLRNERESAAQDRVTNRPETRAAEDSARLLLRQTQDAKTTLFAQNMAAKRAAEATARTAKEAAEDAKVIKQAQERAEFTRQLEMNEVDLGTEKQRTARNEKWAKDIAWANSLGPKRNEATAVRNVLYAEQDRKFAALLASRQVSRADEDEKRTEKRRREDQPVVATQRKRRHTH